MTKATVLGAGLLALLLVVACTDSPESGSGAGGAAAPAGNGAGGASPEAVVEAEAPVLSGGAVVEADLDGPSAEMVTLQEDPYVGAVLYPRPDYEANPWSQWGQGITLSDGRVVSAIGDHLGADGNSYLFVYDPETSTITRFADILGALDHEAGSWGYGKVHSQMVAPGDGGVWFTTYYGSTRGLSFDGSYQGDVLFRLDIETLELQPVTVPVPNHGVPSLATDGNGRIFGEAVDPLLPEGVYPEGGLFVYDIASAEVSFDADEALGGFRNIMVDTTGSAWFADDGGGLFRLDPEAEAKELSEVDLGVAGLRASTLPAADGTIYGITAEPFELFSFTPDGSGGAAVEMLGAAPEYVTSMALTPDESAFLYVPGAHGDAHLDNAPLIAVDTASGEQTTVVELLDLVRDELGVVLGGTYNVTVDASRNMAYIGFNAGPSADEPWGEVVLVAVELP